MDTSEILIDIDSSRGTVTFLGEDGENDVYGIVRFCEIMLEIASTHESQKHREHAREVVDSVLAALDEDISDGMLSAISGDPVVWGDDTDSVPGPRGQDSIAELASKVDFLETRLEELLKTTDRLQTLALRG